MILDDARPWRRDIAEHALRAPPRSQLRSREATALYLLARDKYEGVGRIIDAGAYRGASSWCLAGGLRDAGFRREGPAPIVAYDRFHDYGEYPGRGFLLDYVCNLDPFLDLIEVRQGDFLKQAWREGPIELLFNDICKTLPLWLWMLREYATQLIPDRSLLVLQDYHHPFLWYLHAGMELLAGHFDVYESKVDDSCLFALRSPIPMERLDVVGERLTAMARGGEAAGEILALLDLARTRHREPHQLDLLRVYVLCDLARQPATARDALEEAKARFGDLPQDSNWAVYCDWVGRRVDRALRR